MIRKRNLQVVYALLFAWNVVQVGHILQVLVTISVESEAWQMMIHAGSHVEVKLKFVVHVID